MTNHITIKDINTLLNATQIAVKMFAISKDVEDNVDEVNDEESEDDEEDDEEDEDDEDDDEDNDEDDDEDDEEDEDNDLLRIQLYEMSVRLHELQQNYNHLLLELNTIKIIKNPDVNGVGSEKPDYDDIPVLISIEESKLRNEYKNTPGFLSIDSDFEQTAWLNVDNRQKIIENLFANEMNKANENSIELSFNEESTYLNVICIPLSKLLDQNTTKASILNSIMKQLYGIDQIKLANRI